MAAPMPERDILIVDDDQATCLVLAMALQAEGYGCRLAHSVREAVEILKAGPLPGLILLDLLMPGVSGEMLLQHLALEPAWRNIPVIIMSAWGKAPEVARSAKVEFLAKPFSLEDAESMVCRLTAPLKGQP